MTVQPAAFRTRFREAQMPPAREISDYLDVTAARRNRSESLRGRQPGDPRRGAEAIVDALDLDASPHRLPLGRATVPILRKARLMQLAELDRLAETAAACDYPE